MKIVEGKVNVLITNKIDNYSNKNKFKLDFSYRNDNSKINIYEIFISSLLSLTNNILNSSRNEARLLMNLSLFPSNSYYNCDTFTILMSDFTPSLNKFLSNNNSKIQISKQAFGIYFHKNSSLYNELIHSEQLQAEIRKEYLNNINKTIISSNNFILNKDKNLNYSIGHYTIINPKLTKDGYFRGILFDIYDFDLQKIKQFDTIKTFIYNNAAFLFQKRGNIHNYYILVPIEFKW